MTDAERLRERVRRVSSACHYGSGYSMTENPGHAILTAIVDEAGGPERVQGWIDALPVPTMPEVDEVRAFLATLLEASR